MSDLAEQLDHVTRLQAADILTTSRDRRAVYFVQAGRRGPIKIGLAKDATKRVATLSGGHPVKLTIVGTTVGGRPMERFLHRRFATTRMNGEWFRPSRDLRRWIRLLHIDLDAPMPIDGAASTCTEAQHEDR
jgi:Meiotically up-regulated gene 113